MTRKPTTRKTDKKNEVDAAARERSMCVAIGRAASVDERQMRRSATKAAKIFDAIRRQGDWIDRCAAIRGVLPQRPAELRDIDSVAAVAAEMVHAHLDLIETALLVSDDIYVAVGLVGY